MQRGEIWWADLPSPTGSGPGDRRPLLIVQADAFNASALNTVVAVVLTSTLRLAELPGNTLLPRSATGLPKDSVANANQVVTLDRSLFTETAGRLPRQLMSRVDSGLRLVLGLP